jgi:hypothetical protein
VVVDAPSSGNDTLTLSGCSLLSGEATFTATLAVPAGSLVAPLPLAFSAPIVSSPDTASQGTYTISGDTTTLGIAGNGSTAITAVCPSSGTNECPTETLSPSTLSFTATAGGSAPAAQSITVSTTPALNEPFAIVTSTTTGGSWLTAKVGSASGGQTTGTDQISVDVNPAALGVGNYTGTVKVYAPASNSPQSVTVNLSVTAATFTLNQPPALTFTSVDGTVPAAQNVSVATTPSEAVAYTAAASSTGNWLGVTPNAGTTPAEISVTANPADTTPGSNIGTLTLNATGASNNPVKVNVTFNVTAVTTSPSPATGLSFTGAPGSSIPSQPLSVTATGPNVTYTSLASSTGNWLSVSSSGGTTNGPALTISVNTTGLSANTYNGTIEITPTGATTINVPVKLTLTSLPSMVPSAASLSFTSSAGALPANQLLGISSSNGTAITYGVTASSTGNWLAVSPPSGTTPGSETVSISSSALSALATGTYSGSLLFTCSPTTSCGNPSGQLTVGVTLTVTAALSATPNPITFNYTTGGSTPAAQPISVSSNGAAITYTATAATTSGGAWLSVSPAGTPVTTPTGVTASVNAAALSGLGTGNYSGSITLSSSGNTGVTIPVTLVVTSLPSLSVTGGPLTFNMTNLGSLPAAQNLSVTASGNANIPFTTAVNTTSGGSWLAATPSGTTPATVSVSILANNLGAGLYNGTVQVIASGVSNSPQTVNVQLVVAAAPTISATPNALTYTYTIGGTAPPSQNVSITASGGAVIPYTTNVTTTPPGGSWLSTFSTSTNTPATLQVSVNTSGLAANTYTGTISIASTQASNSPQTVTVTLTVSSLPTLNTSVSQLNFAYTSGGSAPAGQTVNLTGSGGTLNYSATATTTSGGAWLQVTPPSGTTPGTETVSINTSVASTLAPGPYNGAAVFTCTPTSACGNASGQASVGVTLTVTAATFTISGVATLSGSPAPGVTVTLSGSQSGTATTSGTGTYSFNVNPGGNYTVTPSDPGYYFYPYPSAVTFNNISANQTANFSGAVPSDFNGDGHPDIIWEDPATAPAQIWYLNGPEGVTVSGSADLTQTNPGNQIVGIADFDGNGSPDVLWQNTTTGAVEVWYMGSSGGNVFVSSANITEGNPWHVVSVADFNGDGHPDLLWQNPTNGATQIWYMGGAQGTTLLGAANVTASNPWKIVGSDDFNGDGVPDIVWQDPVSGTVQIWYMGGTTPGQQGTQVESSANLTTNPWHVVAIADFYQAGHPDVVFQNQATGASQAFFYIGAQGTTFAGSDILSEANPWFIAGPH